jgi:putative addiction module killer protein
LLDLLECKLVNLEDMKSVGGGVFELRIHYGKGIRIYFGKVKNTILTGGDKGTQDKDIKEAVSLWERYRDEIERHSRDI